MVCAQATCSAAGQCLHRGHPEGVLVCVVASLAAPWVLAGAAVDFASTPETLGTFGPAPGFRTGQPSLGSAMVREAASCFDETPPRGPAEPIDAASS